MKTLNKTINTARTSQEAEITNRWLGAIHAEMQKQTALLTQLASQKTAAQ